MRTLWNLVVVGLLCVACGGGDSYEDVMDAQLDVMEEMLDVLEGVTDEASAKAAEPRLEALGGRLAEVAVRIRELPQPAPEEMQALAQAHATRTQEYQARVASQMMKLGEYPGLGEAFTRAMANAK